jgi:hypothetical protein
MGEKFNKDTFDYGEDEFVERIEPGEVVVDRDSHEYKISRLGETIEGMVSAVRDLSDRLGPRRIRPEEAHLLPDLNHE